MTPAIVRAGIQRSLDRLGVDKIDLLQFHWWTFEHPAYLDALKELAALQREGRIAHLGLTNFNTDHLRVVAGCGIRVASNQICYSLLDRRAGEEMTEFCRAHDIKLLAYGVLGGGFLSDAWVGRPEPEPSQIADWSKMKYRRFIETIGGWRVVQGILAALAQVARKHGVCVANVAARWVMEQPQVAAVIVGARLGESEHRVDNLRLATFALDEADRQAITQAVAAARRIPGDCGDEYRRPPYLTASGDLSHHLEGFLSIYRAAPLPGRADRGRVDSGSQWEAVGGYSRALRVGDRILVSGTTATHGAGEIVCKGDAAGQAVFILDKIAASLSAFGASLADVVRTRIYLKDAGKWEPVARVHGRYFGDVRPANTLIGGAALVGDYDVEIEAEAVLPTGAAGQQ
jgi:aryl-alcohol dehydrogenase-like predicted oxidoreductase/enamine deaminase RidA (YjgF/YER057c/UK114 family)